jgi:diphthamide biosynthesis protein 2
MPPSNARAMRTSSAFSSAHSASVRCPFPILPSGLILAHVAAYLPLITHLRTLLKRARKKSYTLAVGKLNPAKLGNFLEVEAFVLVACPENSLIDAKVRPHPAVPIAMGGTGLTLARRSSCGRSSRRMSSRLRSARRRAGRAATFSTSNGCLQRARSLCPAATTRTTLGKMPPKLTRTNPSSRWSRASTDTRSAMAAVRVRLLYPSQFLTRHADEAAQPAALLDGASKDVILRSQEHALVLADSAASAFLQERSWKGLERRLGEDAPARLEQGRSGIARGYDEDTEPA